MRVALILSDDVPGETDRLALGLERALRGAGHDAERFAVDRAPTPFPGHSGRPGAPRPLAEATRPGEPFDVAVGLGWRACAASFALDARAYAHWVVEPASEATTPADADARDRVRASPAAVLLAPTPARREALARTYARDVTTLPALRFAPTDEPVDGEDPREAPAPDPAPRRGLEGAGPRVLVAGKGGALARELAAALVEGVPGSEAWHAGPSELAPHGGGAARGVRAVGDVPADAVPALLRACDAVLVSDALVATDLPLLEAMHVGVAVVVADLSPWAHLFRDGPDATADGTAIVAGEFTPRSLCAAFAGWRADGDARARRPASERHRASGRLWAARRAGDVAAGAAAGAVVDALLCAAAGARPPSAAARDAFATIAPAAPRAVPEPTAPPRARGWFSRAARAARRAVRDARRAAGPASPSAEPNARPALRPPLPAHEPVAFVGQPDYFRSSYADAVREGWGVECPVRPGDRRTVEALPAAVERSGARTCVVFDPALLAAFPAVVASLRGAGVRLVGWSTEPVPRADGPVHWDALRRYDHLRRARDAGYDLWLHHDADSASFLRAEGFAPLRAHPLPVSASLFFAEDVPRDLDACFLGWSTPHREAFLHRVEARFRVVHVAHGAFDEEARRLMNRSKVVLNLHAHEAQNFENRCVQARFCDRPLVSEELSGGLLAPGADYHLARTPEEFVARVRDVVEGRAPPLRPIDRAPFLVDALRALLAEPPPAGS